MIFKKYSTSDFPSDHAFLAPSSPSWLNWDEETLMERWKSLKAKESGTKLHAMAERMINLGQRFSKSKVAERQLVNYILGKDADYISDITLDTIRSYVNDAEDYGMTPEVKLKFSKYAFGTTDAISFEKERGHEILRIHDLKTGVTPAHIEQTFIYAALFCLEYDIRPGDIEIETRLYQNGEVLIDKPSAEDIGPILDKMRIFSNIIGDINEGR